MIDMDKYIGQSISTEARIPIEEFKEMEEFEVIQICQTVGIYNTKRVSIKAPFEFMDKFENVIGNKEFYKDSDMKYVIIK